MTIIMDGQGHGARDQFLAAHGWGDATITPLMPDASFRSYARLARAGQTCMLMTAPPGRENLPAYLKMTAHLKGLGLRVPRILAADTALGFALIEDFGDDTFTRLLKAGADEGALYQRAMAVLMHVQASPAARAVDVPPYDMATLIREVEVFSPDYSHRV